MTVAGWMDVGQRGGAGDGDYSILQKLYGASQENEERYSPARCIGIEVREISRKPDPKHISTSYVERTIGLSEPRCAAIPASVMDFSRKAQNHAAAVALTYFAYNFIQIHRTLRMTPAMAAEVTG